MEKRFFALVFLAVVLIAGVSAFAPVEQQIDENNPTERFRNSFVFDEGAIRLDKTLQSIPYTLVSDVYWGEDELPKKIIFKDFRVKENLGIDISSKELLVTTAKEFLKKYPELGINVNNLEAIDVYAGSEFFSSASASPTPTPSPTTSPLLSPTESSTINIYPSQQLATVFFKEFIIDGNGEKRYVAGSFVNIVFKIGDDNVQRIVAFKGNYYSDVSMAEGKNPALSKQEVVERARGYLGNLNKNYLFLKEESVELIGYPVNGNKNKDVVILVYKVIFEESFVNGNVEKYTVIVDGNFGRLLNFYNTLWYDTISGRISGSIYPETPSKGQREDVGFKDEYVRVYSTDDSEAGDVITSSDGSYSIEVKSAWQLGWFFGGPFGEVKDAQTSRVIFVTRPFSKGMNINWKDYDTSYKQEQSNAFYHTNIVHDFAVQPHINAEMNFRMKVYINYQDTCNAHYDNDRKSINFYQYGPGKDKVCEATSLFSRVIYHEYGHGVTDSLIILDGEAFPYRGETGNLNEGLSDYVACTIRDIQGVQDPACLSSYVEGQENTCHRRCDSDDKYPDNYDPEPHSGMQIISGTLWDLREKVIAKYGNDEGIKKADGLVFGALRFQPTSFMDYVDGMIMADDDNGNPEDGSPNIKEICDAFIKHGIQSGYCAGFGDLPTAIIHAPKPKITTNHHKVGFIADETLDFVGTVWPGKGKELQSWELRLYDTDKKDEIIFSIDGNSPIKRGILVDDFDFSQLPTGKVYTLELIINDGSEIVTTFLQFIKTHRIKMEIKGMPFYLDFNERDFPKRGEGYVNNFDTFVCNSLNCEFSFDFLSDKADFIALGIKDIDNTLSNAYIFFKKYSYPQDSVILGINDVKPVSSNIREIFEKEQLKVYNKQMYFTVGRTFFNFNYDGSLIYFLAYDNGLYFNDYKIQYGETGINQGKGKLMRLGYLLEYPFQYNVEIDPIQLKTIKIRLFNPFTTPNYISVTTFFSDYIPIGFWWWNDPNYANLPGNNKEYIFYFLPTINGKQVVYYFLAVTDDGEFRQGSLNGVESKTIRDITHELSTDINFFKEPKLGLRAEELTIFFLEGEQFVPKPHYVLRGVFEAEGGIIGHREDNLGFLSITLPDGNIEQITSSTNGLDGSWVLDCLKNKDGRDYSNPLVFFDKSKFCQVGEYKVDWTFGDSDGDGIGDIFKDGRILQLKATYSFDGERFTIKEQSSTAIKKFIRGDANNDGKVDMSDAIRILEMLFQQGELLSCLDAGDVNDDGFIDISDPIYILLYLFNAGKEPPAPFSEAGIDMTEDGLYCQ